MFWKCNSTYHTFSIYDDFRNCVFRQSGNFKSVFDAYEEFTNALSTAFLHFESISGVLQCFALKNFSIPKPVNKINMIPFWNFVIEWTTFSNCKMASEIIFNNAYQSYYAIETDLPGNDVGEVKYVVIYEANCTPEFMINDIGSKMRYLKNGFNDCAKDIWHTMLGEKDINKIANDVPHFPE